MALRMSFNKHVAAALLLVFILGTVIAAVTESNVQ